MARGTIAKNNVVSFTLRLSIETLSIIFSELRFVPNAFAISVTFKFIVIS